MNHEYDKKIIIRKLRAGSLGFDGTRKNMEHHAKNLQPMVEYLAKEIQNLIDLLSPISYAVNLSAWAQGHNVHVLECHDGRKFTLRPARNQEGEYSGVTFLARVSRSHEIPLFSARVDDVNSWVTMKNLIIATCSDYPISSESRKEEE